MNNDTLRKERLQNLIDTISFKAPKKVPVGVEVLSWPLSYGGVRYSDTFGDPHKTAEAYVKFLDIVNLDFYMGGMISRPVKAYQALGCFNFELSSDGNTIAHIQPNIEYMSTDEYPEFINDPEGYRSKLLKRQCKALRLSRDEAYESVKEALKEYRAYTATNRLISDRFDEKGIVLIAVSHGNPVRFSSPLSAIFDRFRGMRDTLLDLKRRPDMVRQACASLLDRMRLEFDRLQANDFSAPFPLGYTVYHVECFLSPPLFDEFFFDPFKELCLPFMEAGTKIFLKGEGMFLNTIDRYRQLPKGSVVIMLDQDDPFEMHKAIGDWQTIATGITSDLLKLGTKDQCVDYVKRCFDTFAPGGGFIFMPNKPLLSDGDTKIENLIAVYETANELSEK